MQEAAQWRAVGALPRSIFEALSLVDRWPCSAQKSLPCVGGGCLDHQACRHQHLVNAWQARRGVQCIVTLGVQTTPKHPLTPVKWP